MQDIGLLLEKTSEINECSILYALLILLKEQQEKEDVYLFQSKSEQ